MEGLANYIQRTLGIDANLRTPGDLDLERLPFYMKGLFRFYRLNLMGRELTLAEVKRDQSFTRTQISKQFETIREAYGTIPVLVSTNLSSALRRILIENRINFIVPGKHLFLPEIMIDLRDTYDLPRIHKEALQPSAQVLVLYWLLRRNERMGECNLKQVATELKYTPMTITNAVADLTRRDLCSVRGTKDKHLQFPATRSELWQRALPFMTTPVHKTIDMDAVPGSATLYKTNVTALSQYADLNEETRRHFAIDRKVFAALKGDLSAQVPGDVEGLFRLEIWKYDPGVLAAPSNQGPIVDPLSLFLSLKDNHDERVEKALQDIMGDLRW